MNILDFVTLYQLKNGNQRIKFTLENESNIYQKLFELGFRRSRLEANRFVLFKKSGLEITPVTIHTLRGAFLSFLQEFDQTFFPKGLSKDEILNLYLDKMPVKANGLLFYHLQYELCDKESHELRLKLNHEYKHRYEIEQLQKQLKEWGFNQAIDIGSSIATNEPLYFKEVGNNQYLLFSHYNSSKKKHLDGFDCWITTFKNPRDVGIKKPVTINDVRLSFQLDRDYQLIAQYLCKF